MPVIQEILPFISTAIRGIRRLNRYIRRLPFIPDGAVVSQADSVHDSGRDTIPIPPAVGGHRSIPYLSQP